MDEGPFRVSRPAAERRGVSRPEPQRQQPEQQQVRPEPQPAAHSGESHHTSSRKKTSKRKKLPYILAIVIVAIVVIGGLLWFGSKNTGTAIDTNKYQAVFFTNGQVYFGMLSVLNDNYMSLTDVYYLQTKSEETSDSENPQQTSGNSSNVEIIKLGNEIHGPEDQMIISKDQVLFYENLKDEGKVVQSIQQISK